jgi:hypothetical protein
MIAFIRSVWLSVCGWKAIESRGSITNCHYKCLQNNAANFGPRSEIIVNGKPCSWMMCVINIFANSFPSMSVRHGTRCHSLVKWSTTIQIASQPFDHGRAVTKSIDISCQGLSGMGRGHNIANGACLSGLERWLV